MNHVTIMEMWLSLSNTIHAHRDNLTLAHQRNTQSTTKKIYLRSTEILSITRVNTKRYTSSVQMITGITAKRFQLKSRKNRSTIGANSTNHMETMLATVMKKTL